MTNTLEAIDLSRLSAVSGGANQQELRSMAAKWCPSTYDRYKNQPTLTRRMGEQCLDEAGFGQYKSQLDKYFPKTR